MNICAMKMKQMILWVFIPSLLGWNTHMEPAPCPEIPEQLIIIIRDTLEQDLYKFTFPLANRNILDMPQFKFRSCLEAPDWPGNRDFFFQFFYNYTPRMRFTRESSVISSYLNLNFLNQLGSIQVDADSSLNVPGLVALFENLKAEERRAGIMFGYTNQRCGYFFDIKTPLIYQERNFFLTDEEQRAIESSPIFNDFDPGTNDEEELDRFKRMHLIADKIGIGDTRLHFGKIFIDNPELYFHAGLESTIPTAFTYDKGLYGNSFPKNDISPPFNLLQTVQGFFEPGQQAMSQQQLITLLIGALDKLSANLLETSLGNGGHLGLGAYAEGSLRITDKLRAKSRATVEYLLPMREKRFYIKKKDIAAFEALNTDPFDDTCTQTFAFLNRQLIETLFPRVFSTIVTPGVLLKVTTGFNVVVRRWTGLCGLDVWWRQQERISSPTAPAAVEKILRMKRARRPESFQAKIFGSMSYRRTKKFDWCLSCHVDGTVVSSGIGKDYNLGIGFQFFF